LQILRIEKRTVTRRSYSGVYVQGLFDAIAHRYDFLNHLLSVGLDRRWRSAAVRLVLEGSPERVLDVATGTGDIALECERNGSALVVGLDLARGMLSRAREKAVGRSSPIALVQGRAEALPFRDGTFDAVVVAFGIRNFEALEVGIRELHRVLRTGGRLVVLEFSQVTIPLVRGIFRLYFHRILPRIGRWISSHSEAYRYLPDTVEEFPHGDEFLELLRRGGFSRERARPMTGGVVTLYDAVRRPAD
jgi:demethylmenaquinone methyltransferase/2-methoxy-6-polyprenyl-1,4-benzoquinol methylase